MDKEIKSLTGIRGIAALWVVCLHYFETLKYSKDLYVSKLFSNGIVAVDIFFLLSAFVMCLAYSEKFKEKISAHDYISFIKKRFARIYPAYFFWLFVFLVFFDFVKFDFNYTKILVNILLIQNFFANTIVAGVFWSLCSEWILYMVFPFIYAALCKIKDVYVKIFLIVTCIIGMYILPSLNNYFIDFHKGIYSAPPDGFIGVVTGVNSIVRCFFSYVIGVNLFLLIKDYHVRNTWVIVFKYSAIIGILIVPYFGKSAETYILILICSIVLMSALYLNKENVDSFFASKIGYFLGQISYSIYLCHMFILIFISILIKKFFSLYYDDGMQICIVLASSVLIIPLSYLSYRFVEVEVGYWLKLKLFNKKMSEKTN